MDLTCRTYGVGRWATRAFWLGQQAVRRWSRRGKSISTSITWPLWRKDRSCWTSRWRCGSTLTSGSSAWPTTRPHISSRRLSRKSWASPVRNPVRSLPTISGLNLLFFLIANCKMQKCKNAKMQKCKNVEKSLRNPKNLSVNIIKYLTNLTKILNYYLFIILFIIYLWNYLD